MMVINNTLDKLCLCVHALSTSPWHRYFLKTLNWSLVMSLFNVSKQLRHFL